MKQHKVKLNTAGHVTLHKVEEKMYSRQELERAWDAGFNRGQVIGGEVDYNKVDTTPTKEQWFEQNVK